MVQAHAQPAPIGQLAFLVQAALAVQEALHLATHPITGRVAEGAIDELRQADIVGVHAALLARRRGQQHLAIAHVVEEQARGRLIERSLGRHDPAGHIVERKAAQALGNGKHLGAEELLQHVGQVLEYRGPSLVSRLVVVIEPRGIAAPQLVHLHAHQVFH